MGSIRGYRGTYGREDTSTPTTVQSIQAQGKFPTLRSLCAAVLLTRSPTKGRNVVPFSNLLSASGTLNFGHYATCIRHLAAADHAVDLVAHTTRVRSYVE